MQKSNKVAIYVRVSTSEQSTELQLGDLNRYVEARGLDIYKVYEDKATGTNDKRPSLKQLLEDARKRKFDVVLCWKLDRFFRSLKDLVNTLQYLTDSGVQFVSYKDNIDLSTASGRLMMQILGSFAEFEASLIKERVLAGLKNAKSKGVRLGRPRKQCHVSDILDLRGQGLSIAKISKELNVSHGLVQRVIERSRNQVPQEAKIKTA
ncbi:MAG: recombinase family protein [bacterium]